MTKFKPQALHIIRIRYWKTSGSGNPPSLIPALRKISILGLEMKFSIQLFLHVCKFSQFYIQFVRKLPWRCQAVVGQSFSCQVCRGCRVVIRQFLGSPLIFILPLIELKACIVYSVVCLSFFLGLSTALANANDLTDWLGIEGQTGLYNFRPSVRPVPLEVHISGYPGKHYCPRMISMNKPAFQAIQQHSPNKPTLIFVSSRRQTRLTALDLIALSGNIFISSMRSGRQGFWKGSKN